MYVTLSPTLNSIIPLRLPGTCGNAFCVIGQE
jgi:hypothetical protein